MGNRNAVCCRMMLSHRRLKVRYRWQSSLSSTLLDLQTQLGQEPVELHGQGHVWGMYASLSWICHPAIVPEMS